MAKNSHIEIRLHKEDHDVVHNITSDTTKTHKEKTSTKRNTMSKTIEILVFPVNGDPYKTQIENTLEAMQKVVGGYIEPVRHPANEIVRYAFDGKPVILIVNEEGKLHNLEPNNNIGGIVGDCFFILDDDFE